MSKQLPSQPNLEHLKKQAKILLKACKQADSQALQRIKDFHPKLSRIAESDRLVAEFSLQDAQHVVAREYGFDSWPKLVDAVASSRTPHRAVACSFCERVADQVENIIHGPSVTICIECVDTCVEVLADVSVPEWNNPLEKKCNFCLRDPEVDLRVIGKEDSGICSDCVKLCLEVLKEEDKPR